MRLQLSIAVAVCGCGVASAQQQASSFFTGVPASQIVNRPIDTSKAIVNVPGTSAGQNRFDFSALFNKRIVPSATPVLGSSPLPPPSSFPSTRYPSHRMVGDPPFLLKWMFGPGQSNIQPLKPFTPGTKPPVGPGS